MLRKCTPNEFAIDGEIAYIYLTDRDGQPKAVAVIDVDDLGRVLVAGRWHANPNPSGFYAQSSSGELALHRFVMDADHGDIIDHQNHNTLDCRKSNLRVCTHTENMQNRRGAHRHSRSGVRGVYWHNRKQRWGARVWANNKKHHVGYFMSLDDAESAVIAARQRLHGDFAS